MTTLNNLKLVAAKRVTKMPLVQQRRNKLVKMIWEQMELCKAKEAGNIYAPMRLRIVKNIDTGEKKSVQMAKRVRAWHWVAESGKTCLAEHYGARTIELAKNMTAVELNSEADLLATLETIKQAVEAGELDTAIANLSGAVNSNFKK